MTYIVCNIYQFSVLSVFTKMSLFFVEFMSYIRYIIIRNSIENKNDRQWVLNIVTIDGQKYSTFNGVNASEGDLVEFEYQQDGKYRKLLDVTKLPEPENSNPVHNFSHDDREERIARQSSIKAAVDILSNDLDIVKVKVYAEILTKYVMEGMSDEEFVEAIGFTASENKDEEPF